MRKILQSFFPVAFQPLITWESRNIFADASSKRGVQTRDSEEALKYMLRQNRCFTVSSTQHMSTITTAVLPACALLQKTLAEVIFCLNLSEVNLNFSLDFMRLRFLPPIYDEVTGSYSMVGISLAVISPTVPEIFSTIKKKKKKKAFWQLKTTWHEEEWQSTHYIQVERILMAQKNEKSKIFIQIWTVVPLVTLEILYLFSTCF